LDPLIRHAIDTSQVTAISYRKAKIVDNAMIDVNIICGGHYMLIPL